MKKQKMFRNEKQMEKAWEEYKEACDNHTVLTHEFSSKNAEFVSKELLHPVSYTIKGFCRFCGTTEQNFYATYAHNPVFEPVIARMREECEVDAREKFELGVLPTQLAGLWMSNYGYTTNAKNDVASGAGEVLVDALSQGLRELSAEMEAHRNA